MDDFMIKDDDRASNSKVSSSKKSEGGDGSSEVDKSS